MSKQTIEARSAFLFRPVSLAQFAPAVGPAPTGLALEIAQSLMASAVKVGVNDPDNVDNEVDNEVAPEFLGTMVLEAPRKGFEPVDAMGDLPKWEEMDIVKSDGRKSIQRDLFWFQDDSKKMADGRQESLKLPVVTDDADWLAKAMLAGESAYHPITVKGSERTNIVEKTVWGLIKNSESKFVTGDERLIVTHNGWIINGILLKSARDGSSTWGSTEVGRKGELRIVSKLKGVSPAPDGDTKVDLADRLDKHFLGYLPLEGIEGWVKSIIDDLVATGTNLMEYNSSVRLNAEELGEDFVSLVESVWAGVLNGYAEEFKNLGVVKKIGPALEELAQASARGEFPVWAGPQGGVSAYEGIEVLLGKPYTWFGVIGRENDFGKGTVQVPKSKWIAASQLAREFIKSRVSWLRWVRDLNDVAEGVDVKFVKGKGSKSPMLVVAGENWRCAAFGRSILESYLAGHLALAQKNAWACHSSPDSQLDNEAVESSVKAKSRENAKWLAGPGKIRKESGVVLDVVKFGKDPVVFGPENQAVEQEDGYQPRGMETIGGRLVSAEKPVTLGFPEFAALTPYVKGKRYQVK